MPKMRPAGVVLHLARDMVTLLHALPLLIVLGVLASGRVSLLRAGLLGTALTIPVVVHVRGLHGGLPALLLRQAAVGAWIAWQAISVIIAGLAFCLALRAARPGIFSIEPAPGALSYRRLFAICFLVGPFTESATGFGIGAVLASALLMRLGIQALGAAVLALYSQILCAWGAVGIGTATGAALIGAPGDRLGVRCALLTAPLLCGYLPLFWHLARQQGLRPSAREKLDDLLWTGLLGGVLYAANRLTGMETAGVVTTAALLVLRYLRDERPTRAAFLAMSRLAAPLALLTCVLLLTRVLAPLRAALRSALVLAPVPGLPAFPLLYHVSVWLLLLALLTAATARRPTGWRTLARSVALSSWTPAAVTMAFMIMAQWMMYAGLPDELARAWSGVAGRAALLAAPLFAGVGGLLTGSNVAANGLLMSLQAALATQAGVDTLWGAAIQNTTSSALTMLSPVRVAMICAVVGLGDGGAAVYRRAAPLGIVAIGVMAAAAFLLAR